MLQQHASVAKQEIQLNLRLPDHIPDYHTINRWNGDQATETQSAHSYEHPQQVLQQHPGK
jgi:hypothetical protein